MPTLRRYLPSSPKNGYYIRANVGGAHPVTLQVPRLAERIFRDNGYDDEDAVPTQLVWAMFDVGLLKTTNSSNDPDVDAAAIDQQFSKHGLTADLSERVKADLIDYLNSWDGPQQHSVQQLESTLESLRKSPSLGKRHHREPRPTNRTELVARLFTWSSSVEEYRRWKQTTENNWGPILKSVRSFYYHPHFEGVRAIEADGSVVYRIESPRQKRVFDLRDHRFGTSAGIDYACSFVEPSGQSDVEIALDNELLRSLPKESNGLDASTEPEQFATAFTPEGLIFRKLPESVISELLRHESADVMRVVDSLELSDDEAFVGTVDRISNAGNPVVEREDGHVILNTGEEDRSYLVQPTTGNKARAIIEL